MPTTTETTITTVETPAPERPAMALDDLFQRVQWVLWRLMERDGRPTKVPFTVGGHHASSTDPKTWASYARVVKTYGTALSSNKKYSGIGWVFSPDDPYCGIDFDDCLMVSEGKREIKGWAKLFLNPFKATYTEFSPSGNGIKAWCLATLPGGGKKAFIDKRTGQPNPEIKSKVDPNYDGGIEIYDRDRYFCFTGNAYWRLNPIMERQQAVEELYALIGGQPRTGGTGASTEPRQSNLERPEATFSGENGAKTPKANLKTTGKIAVGERHDYLMSVAGQYRVRGMDATEILAAIRAVNAERCELPKPEDELRKIVEWVCTKAAGEHADRGDRDLHQPEAPVTNGNAWPTPLDEAAYYGLAGRIVRAIEPHSEADPAAILIQLLVAFGNVIGRAGHFITEADRHFTNMFAVLVGQTAKSRKGTSWGQVRSRFCGVDANWLEERVMGGLSTGEGLAYQVRDAYKDDAGEKDKRLMIVEPEFARVLAVCEREGNTLSAVIRQAWDTGTLRTLPKKDAVRAHNAHIALIAHITKDELRRMLTDTAAANGFANRFLWICCRRSKLLPEGGKLAASDMARLDADLAAAVRFARTAGEVRRDAGARDAWIKVYPALSEGQPGLLGAVTSRAEAQTMRLALLYALLDQSTVIRSEHLLAGLAMWSYAERSARFIFGDALGDQTADEIIRALRSAGAAGMTRTEIREFFARHKPSAEIARALGVLLEYGLARFETFETEGRPGERWFAGAIYAAP